MQAPLNSREQGERCDSALADTFGHPGLLEDAHHVWERPDDSVVANLDDRSRGSDAVAQHGLEPE